MKKRKQIDVVIIGAGPAGIVAALACAKQRIPVLLIEKNPVIGKKILSTGNGKCNLTNRNQYKEAYRSEYPDKAWKIVRRYDVEEYLSMLHQAGILTRDKNGYVYPYSEQASAVRDGYEALLKHNECIQVLTDCAVTSVRRNKKGYEIFAGEKRFFAKCLLICTGGLAAAKLGSSGDGYSWAKEMGHRMVKTYPALTALKSGAPFLKKVSGVRNQAKISLYINGEFAASESGELQWTDYGISGVAVFQLSRYAIIALEKKQEVRVELNFCPDQEQTDLVSYFSKVTAANPEHRLSDLLHGILPLKLCPVVIREARIDAEQTAGSLNEALLTKLVDTMQHFMLRINGYMGYEKAQVTRGGISLQEVDENLQSLYSSGLFFAGEILDVDGTCGGYNLQWAYSSGKAAAKGIGLCLESMD